MTECTECTIIIIKVHFGGFGMSNTEFIKQLREQTGAKILDCKNALIIGNGDYSKALVLLKEKGIESAKRRTYRLTKSGIIGHYVHNNQRLGVLVEIYCETEPATSTQIFKDFVRDIAMHIAAMKPKYITTADVPSIDLEQMNYDEHQAFYRINCLMEQDYYKDTNKSIQDVFLEIIEKLKENVTVKRFIYFEVSDDHE